MMERKRGLYVSLLGQADICTEIPLKCAFPVCPRNHEPCEHTVSLYLGVPISMHSSRHRESAWKVRKEWNSAEAILLISTLPSDFTLPATVTCPWHGILMCKGSLENISSLAYIQGLKVYCTLGSNVFSKLIFQYLLLLTWVLHSNGFLPCHVK
jgi:hypothetical protein